MIRPKLTPEEKLLRIIESSAHKGNGEAVEEGERVKVMRGAGRRILASPRFKVCFIVFVFFIFAAAVLAIPAFLNREKTLQVATIEVSPQEEGVQGLTGEQENSRNPDETAGEDAEALAGEPEGPSGALPVPGAGNVDFAQGLKVVGIMWSDTPQVIIEDTVERRTFLLSAGDEIKGARVKEILKDRVILSYDSQEKVLM